MKQVLTISCELKVSQSQAAKLDALLLAFAQACDYANREAPPKLTNQIAMQSLLYSQIRAYYGLSANLAIQAIRRVCANRKTAKQKGKPVKSFAPTSASYDARIFSLKEKDWSVTLTLLEGRERFELAIGNYQRGMLKGTKPTSATLVKRQDGDYYIQIQVKDDAPEPAKTDNVVGVDFGRRDIAHLSDGRSFSGDDINQVRDHYSRLRATLQQKAAKGTRSSRRRCRQLLQRLSGRERRFQSWLNHTISYRIIQQAKATQSSVAVEDLTGIRERTNELPRHKTERRRSNSWAFFQLRTFLTYKGLKFGVPLRVVNPAYTSQTCHSCLHIHPIRGESFRRGKKFACGHCGWTGDADYNGANMIRLLGLLVDQPGGSWLSCSLGEMTGGLLKAPSLFSAG